ncbi:phage major capsid protein, P2 family [Grimontia hollisae]|uniref:phage major capsid protein, P2 family n=1 Tax=Grimontia hollisae TaxID=673 RepID=UPI000E07C97B|nr:phage major capsid protein, P2 family [Grimontia hollisae]STQ74594.1 phage major capsid protein, P2 family [Grimontia hollisae]
MLNAMSTQYLDKYCANVMQATGVARLDTLFNISPPIETRLREAMLHSVAFLSLISVMPVDQLKGQVVDVGGGALFTGRKKEGRFRKALGVEGNTYELVETDSCASIPWSLLSQWANAGKAGEFTRLMNAAIARHFALDMLRVGFHGTSVAETTNPTTNPMGQDVNKGWLTIVKEKAAGQVLASATLDPTGTVVGSHKNLDAMVNDLRNAVIAEEHVDDPDLVVLIGRDLVASEQSRLMGEADKPTEHNAAQMLSTSVGGMRVYIPPFFPADQIWITSLSNLQVLQQTGTQWRKARNEEDRKAFENSWLRNEGYAIGNFQKFAAIDAVAIA